MKKQQFTNTGTIKFYKPDKGYGFITVDRTGEEYFFHIDSVINSNEIVKKGCKVGFMNTYGSTKGIAARNITIL